MKLQLQRLYFRPDYTIGKLYLNDKYLCDTLEDTYRDLSKEQKVAGATAIPIGVYKVVLSYSNRFKEVLPELLNVPYFEAIRIHAGNFAKDTWGCILVGENKIKGGLINSRKALDNLIVKLQDLQDISITIYI